MRRFGIFLLAITIVFSIYKTKNNEHNEYGLENSTLEGVVSNKIEKKKSIEYYIGDTLAVDLGKKNKKIEIGDKVEIYGKSQNLNHLFLRGFDYGSYLRSKGINRSIIISSYKVNGSDNFFYNLGKVKKYIIKSNRMIYKENSDLLNAILVGDKSGIDNEYRYLFLDSGTSHIMAISGLHIGIIIGFLTVVFGRINTFKKLALISSALYMYNLLVGGGSSITRAIILYIIVCFCSLLDKRVDIINILSIMASMILLKNPYVIYNISFQLSYLSMISIVIFMKYIDKYIYSKIISGTIASSILTGPIILYYFNSYSLVSIMGNLVMIPIIGLIIILDVFSLLLFYLWKEIGIIIAKVNAEIINISLSLLSKIGNDGVNTIEFKNMDLKILLIYYLSTFSLVVYLEIKYINKNKFPGKKVDFLEKLPKM